MLISDSHRFLFVHVQKTGGSTIDNGLTTALGDVRRISAANRHAPLGRLLQLEPGLASYWTAGCRRGIGCPPPGCSPPTWGWPATAWRPRTNGWSPRVT